MRLRTLFGTLLGLAILPGSAAAISYDLHSYDENRHGLWLPDHGHTDLTFDDGATLVVDDAAGEWTLTGTATSRSNPSVQYSVDLVFSGAISGDDFKALTGADDSRIKGNEWANQQDDWRFAENVSGTITRVGGATYDVRRMGGGHNYYAQVGTGLNDKNNDFGISTWIELDGRGCDNYGCRGDINGKLSASAVPEPTAALVFALGLGVMGGVSRRR